MKINKIYISSFGKLQNYTAEFGEHLNTIVEDNGFGKTTIAVFIKCMFYGISGGNRSGLSSDNERVKYMTWNTTQLIGGTIEFEIDGNNYRIERYFGDKPSLDTFKLINLKTNKECSDYSSNIGEEIFGLDSNAFERSTYLPQKALTSSNSNLTTKITTLLGGTEDLSSIDDVVESIEETGKKYLKSNGKSGLMAESKKTILELESRIAECENFENSANALNDKIKEIDLNINQLVLKLEELNPKIEKAIKSNALNKEYSKLLSDIETTKARYLELNEIFRSTPTDLTVFDEYITMAKDLAKLDSKIDSLKNSVDNLELNKYKELFQDNPPMISELDQKIEQCATSHATPNSSIPMWFIIALSVSLVLLVTSIILGLSNTAGIVICVVAIASIITSVILEVITKRKKSNDTSHLSDIKEYLKLYGYTSGDILANLNNLKTDTLVYTRLLKIEIENHEKIDSYINAKRELINKLETFIKQYYNHINDDYEELLESIKSDLKEYHTLQNIMKSQERSLKEYDQDIDVTLNLENLKSQREELNQSINRLKSEKQNTISIQNSYLEKSNLKQDFIQELSIEKEKLMEYYNKYNILVTTASYIREAKDEMCGKFLNPITNNLLKHLNTINKDSNISISIDTDLNMYVIEDTITHDIEYYSKGYKDTFDICLRLALIDTLFQSTKPFIILDDPFVNLDDKKLRNMMSILNTISKEYQIIYLTCSNSRK